MTLCFDNHIDTISDSCYVGGMKRRDLTGRTSGRLTVLKYSHTNTHGVSYWCCVCECGSTPTVRGTSLSSGQTVSCGCYSLESIRRRAVAKTTDITGSRFGRLIARRYAGRDAQGIILWECRCDCGNTTKVRKSSLVAGVVKSCGCYSRELTSKRLTVHGGSGTASHKAWRHMMQRCNNPKHRAYDYYGGRGIKVCDKWADYAAFVQDMGEPKPGETLDRIDPNGDYEPSNCRWASRLVQARNQRMRANISGVTGVYQTQSGKWAAQIRAAGRRFCSPARATKDEAIADRRALEALHWGSER